MKLVEVERRARERVEAWAKEHRPDEFEAQANLHPDDVAVTAWLDVLNADLPTTAEGWRALIAGDADYLRLEPPGAIADTMWAVVRDAIEDHLFFKFEAMLDDWMGRSE